MKAIIKKSKSDKYKYTVTFFFPFSQPLPPGSKEKKGGAKKKTVNFGAKKYSDFTIHKDVERKKRYLARHIKNENWNNPLSAGALSRYLLWNKPTLEASIKDYKKRFGIAISFLHSQKRG